MNPAYSANPSTARAPNTPPNTTNPANTAPFTRTPKGLASPTIKNRSPSTRCVNGFTTANQNSHDGNASNGYNASDTNSNGTFNKINNEWYASNVGLFLANQADTPNAPNANTPTTSNANATPPHRAPTIPNGTANTTITNPCPTVFTTDETPNPTKYSHRAIGAAKYCRASPRSTSKKNVPPANNDAVIAVNATIPGAKNPM